MEQIQEKLKMQKAEPILSINLKIAAKEADETEYWLLLSNDISDKIVVQGLLEDLKIIQKIITKIIATTKNQVAINHIDK